jgi:hypothetical protein
MNNNPLSHISRGFRVWARLVSALLLILTAMLFAVYAVAAGEPFDHDTTGYLLNGAHTRVRCEVCHVNGVFKGTPLRCQGCHGDAAIIALTKKGPNHFTTNAACDDCHTEFNWVNARMDHTVVTGTCVSCHNGVNASGKGVNHVPSSNQCDDCHITIAWSPATFDHSGVTGPCMSCHNGVIAIGKPPGHVPTTDDCSSCHTTNAWIPAL